MYSLRPGLVIGFHGCEESVRNDIVSGKIPMKPSENIHDWLGKGFYFWENNFERALDFAANPPGKKRYRSPAVLGAIIDLQYCLDLLGKQYLEWVKYSYKNLSLSAKAANMILPVNFRGSKTKDLLIRNLDCAVIENLHGMRMSNNLEAFDSARGVFVEGNELYPGAGFKDKNHIQICIRNPNCIKGFFIPRKEIRW
nr:hypothetical protein [uncultured Pedobacter sp.]